MESNNHRRIPIHHSQPRFVDSSTQPLVLYYIWNIDEQSFVRKRIIIPKDIQDQERQLYAEKLIEDVKLKISKGYAAFNSKESESKYIKVIEEENRLKNKEFTVKEAFDNYIKRKEHSLSVNSIKAYKGYVKWFYRFCDKYDYTNIMLKDFTFEKANLFFDEIFTEKSIKEKTHNEIVSFVNTVFSFYKRKKIIDENPCVHELKIVESEESHHPLTMNQIALMKEYILNNQKDEQFWLFINFCFYTFARPRIELRLLKVKNILNTSILITSSTAKKNKNRHVIIPDILEKLIQKHNIRSYPKEYYVFSTNGVPGEKPTGINYFYKRNKETLIACGLTDKEYDLYSWKHTGNIQAKIAGTSVFDLKEQNGHQSVQQTEKYLRKIGAISPQDKDKLKQPEI